MNESLKVNESGAELKWGWHGSNCQNPGDIQLSSIAHSPLDQIVDGQFNAVEIVRLICGDCKNATEVSQLAWQNELPWWTM